LGDGAVPLLPGRVPDLEPQLRTIHVYGLYFEVDPDCGHVVRFELVLAEAHENVRLADAGVPDNDDFQQELLAGVFFGRYQGHCRFYINRRLWNLLFKLCNNL
jgi:hypothetical protein